MENMLFTLVCFTTGVRGLIYRSGYGGLARAIATGTAFRKVMEKLGTGVGKDDRVITGTLQGRAHVVLPNPQIYNHQKAL